MDDNELMNNIPDSENTESVPEAVAEEVSEEVKETVVIDEEETPLDAMDGKRHNWWWLLLVALGLASGKTAYDKKNEKGVFAKKEDKVDNK